MGSYVLGLESSVMRRRPRSCGGRQVLSGVVASQMDLHQRYGGVVPEVASRRHSRPSPPWSKRRCEAPGSPSNV
jgi:N6-L-threonylcarbamoyladenine synthase